MNKLRELMAAYDTNRNAGTWLDMHDYLLDQRSEIADLIDATKELRRLQSGDVAYDCQAQGDAAAEVDAALAKLEK